MSLIVNWDACRNVLVATRWGHSQSSDCEFSSWNQWPTIQRPSLRQVWVASGVVIGHHCCVPGMQSRYHAFFVSICPQARSDVFDCDNSNICPRARRCHPSCGVHRVCARAQQFNQRSLSGMVSVMFCFASCGQRTCSVSNLTGTERQRSSIYSRSEVRYAVSLLLLITGTTGV